MTDTPENPVPHGSEEATSVQLPAAQTQSAEDLAARAEKPSALDLDAREEQISAHRRAAGPPMDQRGTAEDQEKAGSPPSTTPPTEPVAEPEE